MDNKITPNTKLEDFPEILSMEDIAAYLKVSKSVVNVMILDKTIPSFKVGKKIVRVKTKDFIEFLNSNN